jgi:hypothetical protein
MDQLPVGYLFKTAFPMPMGVVGGLGKFLAETMPNAFKAIQSGAGKIGLNTATTTRVVAGKLPLIGEVGASKAMLATTGLGAAAGAAKGAIGAPEGEKGKGALKGALVGGVLGAGTGLVANKLPTIGKQLSQDFAPAGKRLMDIAKTQPNMSAKEFMQRGINYASNNMGLKFQPIPAGTGPDVKNFFGTSKATGKLIEDKGLLSRGIANAATTVKAMQNKGIVEGAASRLKDNWQYHQMHTSKIGKDTFQAPRSGMGRVTMPLMMSGAGMGIQEALQSKNEDGTKRSIGTRIRKGTVSTLGWGLAPPVMVGKLLHDTSKTFMGGRKKPQQDLTNQGVI